MRIELPPYDLSAALALERELGVSHVLAQVLVRRGYREPAAAAALLAPCERHDPSAFAGIEHALDTIARHLHGGSRILVHGDYDVDGVCATAVLVRALRALGAEPEWYLPSRFEDGYGLAARTVERCAARGIGLLITVDCGITAIDEVASARAAGIDVVVTDHHAPRADGALPQAVIVHPEVCGYPCTGLCGTAVAHKLAEALGAATAAEDLELVALATVADLMPLTGENRRLVRDGLRAMAGSRKPGIRALMAVSRVDPSALDASCLGFRLAPRINAAGRLRRADAALELLLTEDAARAAEIAHELDAINHERRELERRIRWEAEAQAAEAGQRSAYVLAGSGWHPGVIGIVASQIAEHHGRPTVLIALDRRDPAAPAPGSARSIPGFDLLAAIAAGSEHLVRYGGHRAAAGLTVLPERIPALRAAIEAHAESRLSPELLERPERVDAVASTAALTLTLAEELLALEPCGIGNPGVRLLVPGARFEGVTPTSDGRHARFTVSSGGVSAAAVAFGCDGRPEGADGEPVNASFRLERNVWNGIVEPRLVLRRASGCRPAEIVVVGEPEDYLQAVLSALAAPLEAPMSAGPEAAAGDRGDPAAGPPRTVLDRCGEGALAVLADAVAAAAANDQRPLVVCADVPRRLAGLSTLVGGITLVSHRALVADRSHMHQHAQVVVLDPPATPAAAAAIRLGAGYTQLAWGAAELRFAQQIHEREFGLRASLVALYRSLRERGRAAGGELERLLRGDETHSRSAALAARLLRVLTELGLVSLDRDLPALALIEGARTELERSTAYRAYERIKEDGERFLSRATPRPSS